MQEISCVYEKTVLWVFFLICKVKEKDIHKYIVNTKKYFKGPVKKIQRFHFLISFIIYKLHLKVHVLFLYAARHCMLRGTVLHQQLYFKIQLNFNLLY